jgi:hypothetical protein
MDKLPVIKGKFIKANPTSRGGPIYSKEVIDREVDKWVAEKTKTAAQSIVDRWNEELKAQSKK